MKILILSRGYPTEKYPMNGIFEFDQAKALKDQGIDVVFAAFDLRSIRRWRDWGFNSFEKEGVKMYSFNLPVGKVPQKLFYAISKPFINFFYRKIVKLEGEISIVHAHFLKIGHIASQIVNLQKSVLVLTEHLSELMKNSLSSDIEFLGRVTYPKMTRVFTVSPSLQTALMKKFGISAKYIPNIVDTSIFNLDNVKKYENFTFVTVGNLIHRKRIDLVVSAFSEFIKVNPYAKLIVIGDGDQRSIIENLITKNQLGSSVTLLGRVDRDNIAFHLKRSHVFVLPSREETFGVVYIEALAAGLPVIATKCGGPEHFVDSSNGRLVEVDDKIGLVNAMIEVYDGYRSYQNDIISIKTTQKFSPSSVANEIIDEYKLILK